MMYFACTTLSPQVRTPYETLTDSVFPAPLKYPVQLDLRSKSCHVPFPRNDDGLTSPLFPHGSIRVLCDSEKVGFEFSSLPSAVSLNDLGAILGDALKRVHGNQDNATISIDAMLGIAVPNGMKHWTNVEGSKYR